MPGHLSPDARPAGKTPRVLHVRGCASGARGRLIRPRISCSYDARIEDTARKSRVARTCQQLECPAVPDACDRMPQKGKSTLRR
jgi:hypothetical protein